MPELPEVETTLCGIKPHILHGKIKKVILRHPHLRWPIPDHLPTTLKGQIIQDVIRRAKYLLFKTSKGTLILHLGMSGSLRILTHSVAPGKHDHVDIIFSDHLILRFTDPRRFGALLWTTENPTEHNLLKKLGPEPLSRIFSGKYLWKQSRDKKVSVKTFLMNNEIVVGVGNIYATEALFAAGLHPKLAAGKISIARYERLVIETKKILRAAIKQGGTTLKNFVDSNGNPGYFKFHLKAYGRAGLPCLICQTPMKSFRLDQRSTVYCEKCQKY